MKITRDSSRIEVESSQELVDFGKFVRPIIEIYQFMVMPRNQWLTDKEKDFYVATVIHVVKGHLNPISPEAVQIYDKYFNSGTTKAVISDYLIRIRKKKWLKYDKFEKVVQIPVPFNLVKPEGDTITFNLSFNYEKANAFE